MKAFPILPKDREVWCVLSWILAILWVLEGLIVADMLFSDAKFRGLSLFNPGRGMLHLAASLVGAFFLSRGGRVGWLLFSLWLSGPVVIATIVNLVRGPETPFLSFLLILPPAALAFAWPSLGWLHARNEANQPLEPLPLKRLGSP